MIFLVYTLLTREVPLIIPGELRVKVHMDVAHRWVGKGVWCPGWSERESQKSLTSVPPNTCRAAVEIL